MAEKETRPLFFKVLLIIYHSKKQYETTRKNFGADRCQYRL